MGEPKTRPVEVQQSVNVIVSSYDYMVYNYSFKAQTYRKAIKVKPILSSYNGKTSARKTEKLDVPSSSSN